MQLFTPVLLRWVQRLGVQPADAEDLLQGVFTILLRKLPELDYDPQRSFRAWLWTVLYHETLAWRKLRARLLLLSPAEIDQLHAGDQVLEESEAEYRRLLFERALQLARGDFSQETWRYFWEVAVVGRSGVEVAQEFRVSPNTVYLARSRVLARLREELQGLDR